MSGLLLRLTRLRRPPSSREVVLDERLDQETLSPHMARDLGLNDASLIYDSRRSDRQA